MLAVDEASALYTGRSPSWLSQKLEQPQLRQETTLAMWQRLRDEVPDRCSTVLATSALPMGVEDAMRHDVPGLTALYGQGLHRTRAGVDLTVVDCSLPIYSGGRASVFEAKLEELLPALEGACHALVVCNAAASCTRIHRRLREIFASAEFDERPEIEIAHGSMPHDARAASLAAFCRPASDERDGTRPRILVTTGRAVRGLELAAGSQPLERVVLFDYPPDAEAYLSRVGCATRGTAPPAQVTAFAVKSQVAFARALLAHDEKGEAHGV
jgi:hypothetical protein